MDNSDFHRNFWFNDYSILFNSPFNIIPRSNMSLSYNLNSITRLCLYLAVFGLFINNKYIIFANIGIIIIIILYYFWAVTNLDMYKRSSINNPFMNDLPFDNEKEIIKKSYNDINDINDNMTENLFLDDLDIYGMDNNMRQFYTIPKQDFEGLGKYISGIPDGCKSYGKGCVDWQSYKKNYQYY